MELSTYNDIVIWSIECMRAISQFFPNFLCPKYQKMRLQHMLINLSEMNCPLLISFQIDQCNK